MGAFAAVYSHGCVAGWELWLTVIIQGLESVSYCTGLAQGQIKTQNASTVSTKHTLLLQECNSVALCIMLLPTLALPEAPYPFDDVLGWHPYHYPKGYFFLRATGADAIHG